MTNFSASYKYIMTSGTEAIRGIEVTNTKGKKKVIEFKSFELSDLKRFRERLLREGEYFFLGGNQEFRAFLDELISQEPKQIHIYDHLGFQEYPNQGIFLSSDCMIVRGLVLLPEDGIFSVGEGFYKASSNLSSNKIILGVKKEASFSSLKSSYHDMLVKLTSAWSKSLNGSEEGLIALAFLWASLYATPIIDHFGFFPFLFVGGEKGSGKNFFCKTLVNVLGIDSNGEGLTQSTPTAILRKSMQFKDIPYWIDEYSDNKESGRKIEGLLRSAFNRSAFIKSDLESQTEVKTTVCNAVFILSGESMSSDIATRERFVNIILDKRKQNAEGRNELLAIADELSIIGTYWIGQRTSIKNNNDRVVEGIEQELKMLMGEYPNKDSRLLTLYAIISYFLVMLALEIGLETDTFLIISRFLEQDAQTKEGSTYLIKFWEDFITLVREGTLVNGVNYYMANGKLAIHFPSVKSAIFQARSRERLEQRIEEDTLKLYLIREYECTSEVFSPRVDGMPKRSFRGLGFNIDKLPNFVQEHFTSNDPVSFQY